MHPLKLILQDGWIQGVFQTVSQTCSALLSSPEFVSSGRGDSLFLVQFKGQYTGNLLRFLPTTLKLQYSRTSRKRPPKMQRLSGRLREVVAYKNRTSRGLLREEVQAHLLYGR